MYIQNLPLSKRKTTDQFQKQLKLAMLKTEGARLDRRFIRRTSAQAQDYIVAYYNLHYCNGEETSPVHCHLKKSNIEKMRRTYWCHRSIYDISHSECSNVAKEIQEMQMKEKMNGLKAEKVTTSMTPKPMKDS